MHLRNVRWLNGGYCLQNTYLAGGKSLGFRRFYAVFLYFEHPEHGACLIDTGYGPAVMQTTKRWPWMMLRATTPIPRSQPFQQRDYLETLEVDATKLERIFISHFHADHIGGLSLFPHSELVYRNESLDWLQNQTRYKQLSEGYLPALMPDDYVTRSTHIDERLFVTNASMAGLRTLDYWNDGSLLLVDLPGHAIGHTGYLLAMDAGPVLYVVDAFWDRHALDNGRRLPWLSRQIHHDHAEYERTNQAIRNFCANLSLNPLACHCPATQQRIG